jgi:O-antigen ligase
MSLEAPPAPARRTAAAALRDDWPHTKRLMPWLIAVFVGMVFLIPINGIDLKVHLPFDSKIDRFALAGMVGLLIVKALLPNGESPRPRRRPTFVMVATLGFGAVALLSILPNADTIYRLGELTFDEKALSQLLAYIAFFLIVATQVRRSEIHAFGKLILGLALLTALGTLWESRTGYNVFYDLSSTLFSPIAHVAGSPTNISPTVTEGRKTIVGPTEHGLALASMLTIALPFAVIRMSRLKTKRRQFTGLLCIGLLLAASLSTGRKTAIIAPIAAFVVLVAYNPRWLRFSPLALIALIPAIHFAAPGALGTFDILANSQNSSSTQQRVSDYSGVAPDLLTHPVLGRGYGSWNTQNTRWYRILDNEYLGEALQVGFLGLAAYLLMVLGPLVSAHGVIRRSADRAPDIVAAAAGCAAFAVVCGTFDAMSFPQAPYTFFFSAGLVAAAAAQPLAARSGRFSRRSRKGTSAEREAVQSGVVAGP